MKIEEFRKKIDEADRQLLQAFTQRMRVSEEIGAYKKAAGLPVRDPAREAQKLESIAALLPEDLRDYGARLYQLLFSLSREHQEAILGGACGGESGSDRSAEDRAETSGGAFSADPGFSGRDACLRCGLLGRTLGHSWSPAIHRLFNLPGSADGTVSMASPSHGHTAEAELQEDTGFVLQNQYSSYNYDLYETGPQDLDTFLFSGKWDGLNVTIPYKKEVAGRCAVLSKTARRLGSVNTVVRMADGRLYGDNTDYAGFLYLVKRSGILFAGKTAVVLGSGGASAAVCAVLQDLGADVKVVSRTGAVNYGTPAAFTGAQILVNTTPVGMYPGNGESPVDLRLFRRLEAVFDIVYNPVRTVLLLQAEVLGIPAFGGLPMLVAQAWKSREVFLQKGQGVFGTEHRQEGGDFGREDTSSLIEAVTRRIREKQENLILIGMPGCGKTTLGHMAAEAMGRPFFDSDEETEKKTGMKSSDLILSRGEDAFRRVETEVLSELGKKSGAVIATGGGAVTRRENYGLLRQNGRIVWICRDPGLLPETGRPLSLEKGNAALYEVRRPLYESFADDRVDNNGSPESALAGILRLTEN